MSLPSQIRGLLSLEGKKIYELAEYFDMSPQAMRNKICRSSFSSGDLKKFANFLEAELVIETKSGQRVVLNEKDN